MFFFLKLKSLLSKSPCTTSLKAILYNALKQQSTITGLFNHLFASKIPIRPKPPSIHLTNRTKLTFKQASDIHRNAAVAGTGTVYSALHNTLAFQFPKSRMPSSETNGTFTKSSSKVIWMNRNCIHVSTHRTQWKKEEMKKRDGKINSKHRSRTIPLPVPRSKTAFEAHWPTCTKITHFSSYATNWSSKRKAIVKGHQIERERSERTESERRKETDGENDENNSRTKYRRQARKKGILFWFHLSLLLNDWREAIIQSELLFASIASFRFKSVR